MMKFCFNVRMIIWIHVLTENCDVTDDRNVRVKLMKWIVKIKRQLAVSQRFGLFLVCYVYFRYFVLHRQVDFDLKKKILKKLVGFLRSFNLLLLSCNMSNSYSSFSSKNQTQNDWKSVQWIHFFVLNLSFDYRRWYNRCIRWRRGFNSRSNNTSATYRTDNINYWFNQTCLSSCLVKYQS